MYYDIHSHILPGIDDGAADIEMSLKMLEAESSTGVTHIAATPHFYLSEQSVGSFCSRREEALCLLRERLDAASPEIIVGAEVLYTPSLADAELKGLCIGDTRYMLTELPYRRLTSSFIRSFKSFCSEISQDITPILAHAERYLAFTEPESIYEIIDSNILVQLNCGSFRRFSPQMRFISTLAENGCAHFLGTDCHNISTRRPNMDSAKKYISRKFSPQLFERFMQNAADLFSGKKVQR